MIMILMLHLLSPFAVGVLNNNNNNARNRATKSSLLLTKIGGVNVSTHRESVNTSINHNNPKRQERRVVRYVVLEEYVPPLL